MYTNRLNSGPDCRHASGSTSGIARVIVKIEDLTVSRPILAVAFMVQYIS
jgi:hypothetical protein